VPSPAFRRYFISQIASAMGAEKRDMGRDPLDDQSRRT
jgi:hypothetical protein